MNVETLLRAVGDLTGVTATDSIPDGSGSKIYRQTWFNVLVLLGWTVDSLMVGYLGVEQTELG
ncbi:hypothetical protein [Haladaptatus halobius]|uniref:hypothetical protein n=1 Tax=Haladaptatus halobius TaxID=2884875 RepID=UPI001D0ACB1B|nr:hypothetical protein [Haladaptatus halobius]